jgi:hypothetical protein
MLMFKDKLTQLEAISDRAAAPILILAAVIDVSCFLVSLRVPFGAFGYTLATILTVCALALIFVDRSTAISVWSAIGLSMAARWLLAATVWRACQDGLGALYNPDFWSYSVFSRYLWYDPRGAQGGLPLTDQWASHLAGTRFATPSLLDFVSVFVRPGDPAAGMLLFLGISCVALFFSVLFLSRRLGLSYIASVIAAALSIATGWYFNAVLVSNFDNIIFIALFTTLLGFLIGTPGNAPWTRLDFLAMAVLLAACLYTYPEGMALEAVLALPVLTLCLRRVLTDRHVAIRASLLALISVAITWPYLGIGLIFLRGQFASVSAIRPGAGNFEGLLTHSFLPAAFALGDEYPATTLSLVHILVALVLLALTGFGLRRLYRLSPGMALVPIPLLALCLWQGLLAHYAYGTFKVLFLAVWWTTPVIAVGVESAAEQWLPRYRLIGTAMLASCLVAIVWFCRIGDLRYMPSIGAPCISAPRDLEELRHITAGAPLILAANNDFDYLWAAYFLRDVDVLTPVPRGYFAMPHVLSLLANARKPRGDRRPLDLVSGKRVGALWSNGKVSLITGDSSEILKVDSPNGLEVGDEQFFWLGNQPATVFINSGRAGPALLTAKEFLMGPSAPGLLFRSIITECGQHRIESRFTANSGGIPIYLDIGIQECRVWCKDTPTLLKQPNGDTRPLLLGIKGYYIGNFSGQPNESTHPDPNSSRVPTDGPKLAQVRSPNGLEVVGGDQFFWLGTQPVTLVIEAGRKGSALLRAKEFLPGPSAPKLLYRTVIAECGLHRTEYRITKDSVGIPLQLDRGMQECTVRSSDVPSVLRQPSGDPRVLLLGLKGYYLTDAPDSHAVTKR